MYGLDKYYSENPIKIMPISEKDKFEINLARAKFIISFPEEWLNYITKGNTSVPFEKYDGFKGFYLDSIEKTSTFDQISKYAGRDCSSIEFKKK